MHKAIPAVFLAATIAAGPGIGQTLVPPMSTPIPGTWEDRSEMIEMLPIQFQSIWYEAETVSLIHVQISVGEAPIERDAIEAWVAQMRLSTSFWGEPPHPNAAQVFANQVYLQPTRYNEMMVPFIEQAIETGASVETPAIWEMSEVEKNPHIFYHAQITPRLVLEAIGGEVMIAEGYVPLDSIRVDFVEADGAESIVLEVQTTQDALAEAVDALAMPAWLKGSRFRYCAVLHAEDGFANPARAHVWLASPLDSGIDCNHILDGFGQ